jgi:hypothetical protein
MTNETNAGVFNKGSYNTGDGNTGNYNTGDRNTGNYNAGYHNTGGYNTGEYNTGDYNTGYYNTGNYHVGCFNTVTAGKAYYFNCLIDKADWDNAEKPSWISHTSPTTWVPESRMTAEEKSAQPSYKQTGGYLRTNDMKSEWSKAFAEASPEDIELTKALPAFDARVFLEITGIDLHDEPKSASWEGREIEVDGATYVLKLKGETE